MTATRDRDEDGLQRLVIRDADGDRMTVTAWPAGEPRVLVTSLAPAVGLDLNDALALLSFVSDAFGVERYVPQVELRDVAVVAEPLHPSWTVERVDPAPGGAS